MWLTSGMTTWLTRALVTASLSCSAVTPVFAQGPDVGIAALGVVSIQPVDDTYVNGPYLDAGLGGVTLGIGASLTAVTESRLLLGAEFSTASYEVEQSGRLVGGSGADQGRVWLSQSRDSLLVGLLGREVGTGRARGHLVGGAGIASSSVSRDGVSLENSRRPAFTAGADLLIGASTRVAWIFGARYTFVARDEDAAYRGLGNHVIRTTAGLRIRVN